MHSALWLSPSLNAADFAVAVAVAVDAIVTVNVKMLSTVESFANVNVSAHTHTRTPRHVLRALQCNLNSIENPRTTNQHKLQCDGNVYTHELITKSVVSTCTDTHIHTCKHSVRVCIVTEKKQDHIANVSEQRVTDREIEN